MSVNTSNVVDTGASEDAISIIFAGFGGANDARFVAIASLTMIGYDALITMDQEVKYFWTGSWTLTRTLYFWNRYFPPLVIGVAFIGLFGNNLSMPFCNGNMKVNFVLTLFAMVIVQAAALVTRTYYLYSFNRAFQAIIVLFFVGTIVATGYEASLSFAFMQAEVLPTSITVPFGCALPPPIGLWRVLLPTLVLHVVIFVLTIARAVRRRRRMRSDHLMMRLLRDGGVYFFVIFLSVGLTVVGSMINGSFPIIFSAVYSDYVLAMTSVATCRIILSIRSLADDRSGDPIWLLSDTEMTRVALHSRKGANSTEMIVSVGTAKGTESEAASLRQGGEPGRSRERLRPAERGDSELVGARDPVEGEAESGGAGSDLGEGQSCPGPPGPSSHIHDAVQVDRVFSVGRRRDRLRSTRVGVEGGYYPGRDSPLHPYDPSDDPGPSRPRTQHATYV